MIARGLVHVTRFDRHGGKGRLSAIPFRDLPFTVERAFWIEHFLAVGGHAAMESSEVLFVLTGAVEVTLRRPGEERSVCLLRAEGPGILIPAGWWRTVARVPGAGEARVLCLCSGQYDEKEMIRDYAEFEKAAPWKGASVD